MTTAGARLSESRSNGLTLHIRNWAVKFWLPVIIISAVSLLYALSLDWTVSGYDDADYLMIARSLASGSGYQIAQANTPWDTTPLFPLLLAPLWLLNPPLPQGIALFKLVPLVCALLSVPVLWLYFTRSRQVSALIAGAIITLALLSPPTFGFAAREVMTELPYMLFSGTVLCLAHQALVRGTQRKRVWLGLALAIAAAWLTRTVGLTLFMGCLMLLLSKRRWQECLALACLVGILLAPWQLYLRSRGDVLLAPSQYQSDFMLREYGQPEFGTITSYWEVIPRVLNNIAGHVNESLPSMFLPAVTGDSLSAALQRLGLAWIKPTFGVAMALLMVLGWSVACRRDITPLEWYIPLYLGIILLPPWNIPRNLVPIAPFLLYYFWLGLNSASQRLIAPLPALKFAINLGTMFVFAGIVTSMVASDRHLIQQGISARAGRFVPPDQSLYEAADWLRQNVPASATVASLVPKKLELYLGRGIQSLPDIGSEPDQSHISRSFPSFLVLQPNRPGVKYDRLQSVTIEAYGQEYSERCKTAFISHQVPHAFVYKCETR